MASGMQTVIYPVKDLESAKKVYTALLGTPPAYEAPYYVGWNIGGQDIGLDPNGHRQGLTAPLPYWLVDDINTAMRLGYNWPIGPLEWGERLGWSTALGVLEELRELQGEAYRPAPALRGFAS